MRHGQHACGTRSQGLLSAGRAVTTCTATHRLREKGDFHSELPAASGRRPRRSPSAKMYERASTWVKRRASAAEVAAARLLSLTMRSKATPGTDAPGPELQKGTLTAERRPAHFKHEVRLWGRPPRPPHASGRWPSHPGAAPCCCLPSPPSERHPVAARLGAEDRHRRPTSRG